MFSHEPVPRGQSHDFLLSLEKRGLYPELVARVMKDPYLIWQWMIELRKLLPLNNETLTMERITNRFLKNVFDVRAMYELFGIEVTHPQVVDAYEKILVRDIEPRIENFRVADFLVAIPEISLVDLRDILPRGFFPEACNAKGLRHQDPPPWMREKMKPGWLLVQQRPDYRSIGRACRNNSGLPGKEDLLSEGQVMPHPCEIVYVMILEYIKNCQIYDMPVVGKTYSGEYIGFSPFVSGDPRYVSFNFDRDHIAENTIMIPCRRFLIHPDIAAA